MKYVHLLVVGLVLALSAAVCQAAYHTNTFTTPNDVHAYTIDGTANDPTLNLVAGVTNIFVINTFSDHPVVITTNPPPSVSSRYFGASPQNINSGQIVVNTATTGFPTKLYYICSIHGFGGEIDLSASIGPTPPRNTILQIKVGTNIVMTSTGTNTTWLLVPEYSTNIASRLWTPVPSSSYTNSYSNGTNRTVLNRLDSIAGPKVYLRLSQQPH